MLSKENLTLPIPEGISKANPTGQVFIFEAKFLLFLQLQRAGHDTAPRSVFS